MSSKPDLPDPDLCRTKFVVNDIWECAVERSADLVCCRYALEFGFSHFFCKHPQRHTFTSTGNSQEGAGEK